MRTRAALVVGPEEGRLGPFRILATGEQTGGAYFALDSVSRGVPLGEPHLHVDAFESEYVATGERRILVGDQELAAPAGSFVVIPPNVAHDMTGTAGSRWFHLFSPPGIERWFVERERMRERGASPAEIDAAAERYGVRAAARAPGAFHAVVADAPVERRVLATGRDTGGAYEVTEYADVLWRYPSSPHAHDHDEALYVAAGELEITVASERIRAVPGTFVFVPRGVSHGATEVAGESARFIEIRSPAR
jgi:quercetin dioxygenase-like cupin family protein